MLSFSPVLAIVVPFAAVYATPLWLPADGRVRYRVDIFSAITFSDALESIVKISGSQIEKCMTMSSEKCTSACMGPALFRNGSPVTDQEGAAARIPPGPSPDPQRCPRH